MKLIFAASTLCLGLFFTLSAMRPLSVRNTKTPEINSDWGEWINVSCYKGIDFRTKKGDYNSYARKWLYSIQFRNRYYKRVSFNYSVNEPGEDNTPDHRKHIDASEASDVTGTLLYSANGCRILINKVRFGDDYEGDFVSCDQ